MMRFDVIVKTIKGGVVTEQKVEAIAKRSIDAGNHVLMALGIQGDFKVIVKKAQEVQHA
jgi:hypothetical protein